MASLYSIGSVYLNYSAPIENGGVVGEIIKNMDFTNGVLSTNTIQNIELWTSYIKGFVFNQTRLRPTVQNLTYQLNNFTPVNNPYFGPSILMIIWLITFMILTIVLIIVLIKVSLNDRQWKKVNKHLKTRRSSRSRTKGNYRRHIKRNKILILTFMTLAIILWIVFMVMVCIAQYLLSSQLSSSGNNNSSPRSIKDALSISFQHLANFLNIISNQTSLFLTSSLSRISTSTRNQLLVSIVSFGNQVLGTLNITKVFNTTAILIDGINTVVTSMTTINNDCKTILEAVDNLKGSVNVYRNNLNNYLNNVCPSLSDKYLQDKCRNLQSENAFFQVNIQTSAVSSSSSVIMQFILQQYNINITNIATTFRQVNSSFQTQLNILFNSTVNKFDISSYLDSVPKEWNHLLQAIVPNLPNISIYNTTANSFIDTASKYESIVIVIIIFLFLLTFVLLLSSFRDSIQKKFLNRCLNCFVQLLSIFILIVSAVVCIGILITANFSQAEICYQVNSTNGVTLLDQMVNAKLSDPWKIWTQAVQSPSPDIGINLVQPINILSGIKDRCRNTSRGLLYNVGMGNMVNVSRLVHSPSIMNIVRTAGNDSLKEFLNVNPQQIIPSDVSAFLSQTSSLISYFDGVNYEAGIKELQKPLLGFDNFLDFFGHISTFTMNASRSIGWTSDLKYLNDTITMLFVMAPSFASLQQNISNLTGHFQTLQNHRQNKVILNELVTTIAGVQSLFLNITMLTSIYSSLYSDLIAINLVNTVQKLISDSVYDIIYQILPCQDLAIIFETVTNAVCSHSSLNTAMATFGILLLIVVVLSQIILIIIITAIALRLNINKV